jgi:hypothetical protein
VCSNIELPLSLVAEHIHMLICEVHYVLKVKQTQIQSPITENSGRVVNTPASYSEGPGFKSRPQQQAMPIEVYRGFLRPSRRMPV